VYAPTQSQTGAQATAMKITGLPHNRVRVHPTLLGGGFGRRFENDFVADAVEVSKKIAKPVKVVWTREADIQHDFYNPMYVNAIHGVLDENGKLIALDHTVVSAGVMKKHFPTPPHTADEVPMTYAADIPYGIPNQRVSWVEQDHGIPVGFLRAPGANWNAFVVETFLDELAHDAKADPLAFRLAMLEKTPRLAAVLKLAAEKGGWGNAVEQGHALGLAATIWAGSYAAVVADVSMEQGLPRVHRATMAVDVGQVVNPEIVAAQAQSGANYGLGLAMTSKITLKNGRVEQSNFFDYTVLRHDQAPVIDVHIVPSTATPTGVGELGTPPIAPAIANAVFMLTGKRIRSLPFKDALA